jgi:hypothetical protein
MMHIEHILNKSTTMLVKQLVWTASILPKAVTLSRCQWLQIEVVYNGNLSNHDAGMKKVVLRTADEMQ